MLRLVSVMAFQLVLWPAAAWGAETCDGVDNDGNGAVDEGCGLSCLGWSTPVRNDACTYRLIHGVVDGIGGGSFLQRADFSVNAGLHTLIFRRTWSAGLAETHVGTGAERMGEGWSHSLNEWVFLAGDLPTSDAHVHRGDGSVEVFPNQGSNLWSVPRRMKRNLTRNGPNFILEDADGLAWTYASVSAAEPGVYRAVALQRDGVTLLQWRYSGMPGASACAPGQPHVLCTLDVGCGRRLEFTYGTPSGLPLSLEAVDLVDSAHSERLATYEYAANAQTMQALLSALLRNDGTRERYGYVNVGSRALMKEVKNDGGVIMQSWAYDAHL